MKREQRVVEPKIIEELVDKALRAIGIEDLDKDKSRLFLRLLFSGLGQYFFINPDDLMDIGFIRLAKNPKKEEIFSVNLIKNPDLGIVNADTLWKYYRGELIQQEKFKELIEGFMEELISYSQEKEMNITELTSRYGKYKEKEKNYGI